MDDSGRDPLYILNYLRSFRVENEWLEFKEARFSYDFEKVGVYISALSNGAFMSGKEAGFLLFGIKDLSRKIVGTSFLLGKGEEESLKSFISTNTNLVFPEIYVLYLSKRVVMVKIKCADGKSPTSWHSCYYFRKGESVCKGSVDEVLGLFNCQNN